MKYNQRQLDLLAQGAPMEAVLAAATPVTTDPQLPTDPAAKKTKADTPEAPTAEAHAELAGQLTEALAKVQELEAKTAENSAALATANAAVETANADKAKAEETANAMYSAIHARTSAMAIALSQTAPAQDMSAADLAALHTKLDADFKASYKPGKQSSDTKAASNTVDYKAQMAQDRMLAAAKTLPGSI